MHEGKVGQTGVLDIEESIWRAEYRVSMGDVDGCGCCLP